MSNLPERKQLDWPCNSGPMRESARKLGNVDFRSCGGQGRYDVASGPGHFAAGPDVPTSYGLASSCSCVFLPAADNATEKSGFPPPCEISVRLLASILWHLRPSLPC